MFNPFKELFTKRSWVPEVVPETEGQLNGLSVRIHSLPCFRDELSGDRKYAYSDFGRQFISRLYDCFGTSDQARETLNAGKTIRCEILLKDCDPVAVHLSGKTDSTGRMFDSDIADLLIAAFESIRLAPR